MKMKQLIVQSIEDSTKSINDCLEVGIEPNERIPSNLPEASSSTVDEWGSCYVDCVIKDLSSSAHSSVVQGHVEVQQSPGQWCADEKSVRLM